MRPIGRWTSIEYRVISWFFLSFFLVPLDVSLDAALPLRSSVWSDLNIWKKKRTPRCSSLRASLGREGGGKIRVKVSRRRSLPTRFIQRPLATAPRRTRRRRRRGAPAAGGNSLKSRNDMFFVWRLLLLFFCSYCSCRCRCVPVFSYRRVVTSWPAALELLLYRIIKPENVGHSYFLTKSGSVLFEIFNCFFEFFIRNIQNCKVFHQ